jgi:hypothetical protein
MYQQRYSTQTRIKDANGIRFEDLVIAKHQINPKYKETGSEQDRFQGTDFEWDGIPVDITLKPSKLGASAASPLCEGCVSKFAWSIRICNQHGVFTRPVLVIHVASSYSEYINYRLITEHVRDLDATVLDLAVKRFKAAREASASVSERI